MKFLLLAVLARMLKDILYFVAIVLKPVRKGTRKGTKVHLCVMVIIEGPDLLMVK